MSKQTYVAVLCVLALMIGLVGCGDKKADKPQPTPTTEKPTTAEKPAPVVPPAVEAAPPATPAEKPAAPAEKPAAPAVKPAPPSTPAVNAATPAATGSGPMKALETMRDAAIAGDGKAFANCFDATDDQAKALASMAEVAKAQSDFEAAMVKAYGKDALGGRMDSQKGFADANLLKGVTIKEDGDTAIATKAGDDTPLKLVKKDGVWKVDANAMMGPTGNDPASLQKMVKMTDTVKGAIAKVMPLIGKEGYSAEKIQEEFAKAMMPSLTADMLK